LASVSPFFSRPLASPQLPPGTFFFRRPLAVVFPYFQTFFGTLKVFSFPLTDDTSPFPPTLVVDRFFHPNLFSPSSNFSFPQQNAVPYMDQKKLEFSPQRNFPGPFTDPFSRSFFPFDTSLWRKQPFPHGYVCPQPGPFRVSSLHRYSFLLFFVSSLKFLRDSSPLSPLQISLRISLPPQNFSPPFFSDRFFI